MPCYDSRDDARRLNEADRLEWMHNSPVAEMLCWAMSVIERAEVPYEICKESEAAKLWYQAHKERDQALAMLRGGLFERRSK